MQPFLVTLLLCGLVFSFTNPSTAMTVAGHAVQQRYALQFLSSSAPNNVEFDEGMAEIAAYYPAGRRLYVANKAGVVDVIDISNPSEPKRSNSITFPDAPASVYILNDVLAVTITGLNQIMFISLNSHATLATVATGSLPDSVVGSHNKKMFVVACEGEPEDDYSSDPEGEVWKYEIDADNREWSEINIRTHGVRPVQMKFDAFNSVTLDNTIRIFGPGT